MLAGITAEVSARQLGIWLACLIAPVELTLKLAKLDEGVPRRGSGAS